MVVDFCLIVVTVQRGIGGGGGEGRGTKTQQCVIDNRFNTWHHTHTRRPELHAHVHTSKRFIGWIVFIVDRRNKTKQNNNNTQSDKRNDNKKNETKENGGTGETSDALRDRHYATIRSVARTADGPREGNGFQHRDADWCCRPLRRPQRRPRGRRPWRRGGGAAGPITAIGFCLSFFNSVPCVFHSNEARGKRIRNGRRKRRKRRNFRGCARRVWRWSFVFRSVLFWSGFVFIFVLVAPSGFFYSVPAASSGAEIADDGTGVFFCVCERVLVCFVCVLCVCFECFWCGKSEVIERLYVVGTRGIQMR